MKLRIKYFGSIAEKIGFESEILQMNEPYTSGNLTTFLTEKYQLQNMNWRLAVNQELLYSSVELKEDDELALLPPFAGG